MNVDTEIVIPTDYASDKGVITSAIGPEDAQEEIERIVGHSPEDADATKDAQRQGRIELSAASRSPPRT